MKQFIIHNLFMLVIVTTNAMTYHVGATYAIQKIQWAINQAKSGDTIIRKEMC